MHCPAGNAQPLHDSLRWYAQTIPHKAAIVWYGREISYGELDRLSDACAALLAKHGVSKGDPVALFMQNCPQYIIALLGIQKLGALASPCSPLFKAHELAYQLADLGARVVIAADNLYPIVQKVMSETQLRTVMLVHYQDMLPETTTYAVPQEMRGEKSFVPNTIDLLAAMENENTAPPKTELAMNDVALLVYTSGTTGRPKGAMLTFGNVLFKTAGVVQMGGLRQDDVHLAIPPLCHISGMLYGMNIPLYSGATTILHYRFDALSTLESIARHKVSYWKGIAPMLTAVMEAPGAASYDVSSLRVTSASSFGIRMTQELSRCWTRFTGGCVATEAGYGLTETHTADVMTLPENVRWGTNGQLLPGVRCRIVDPVTSKDLPCGAQGEIVLYSPGNFLGYWKQPEKSDETLRDGWVYTGDIGKIDEDGYLTLLGRIKAMIKVSGYSVFPEDVEAILLKHPQIDQVAVLGAPDRKGKFVKAVVVLKPNVRDAVTAEALIHWSRENMSAYKVPRDIEFRTCLPTTVSGKVLRRLL